uniref:Fumarate lyase (AspA) n=1 Tax=uncultured marine thaumarchaeote SAT1000_14_E04 TaxID=1456383 RepID=A0A075I967_9ARCH|nr:Fumarate lyase (aspA) [uncultured marine thaumarchaeote SAT1000_14_E04]
MRYRSDRDSLGSVKIPADAYYGPFTGRAIKQYHVTEQNPHPYLIRSFVMIKRSAAITNMKAKKLDSKQGNVIVKACDKILAGRYQDQFVVDMINSGAGTAFNMNVNEVIANISLKILGKKLGQYQYLHPNDHVNMSQSSNDTYPTAMHMSVLFALDDLIPIIKKLEVSLDKKSKQFEKYKKIGRTHLMDALPVTLGSEFHAYSASIRYARLKIEGVNESLYRIALGGTAVGTGANTPSGYSKNVIRELARISNLPLKPATESQHALQSRLAITHASSFLRNLAVELGKISNDIRLMASGPVAGFGELEIPEVHAGSSIMPGKVNPSLAECMNMICFSIIGNDTTVAFAAQAGQLELNVMLPVMLKAVLDSTDMLTNFTPIFTANLIAGLTANKEKLQSNIEKSPVIVTLLAPKIGYQKSAELFKESLKTGKTIRELVISKKLMTKKQVDSLLK